jgi:hypothetical protein
MAKAAPVAPVVLGVVSGLVELEPVLEPVELVLAELVLAG